MFNYYTINIVNKQATKLRIKHQFNELTELECKTFLNEFLEAINYTRCCEELKVKEAMTFEEYLISEKYIKTDKGNWFKGMEMLSSRDLINKQREYRNL